jgi:hypothetical protein
MIEVESRELEWAVVVLAAQLQGFLAQSYIAV